MRASGRTKAAALAALATLIGTIGASAGPKDARVASGGRAVAHRDGKLVRAGNAPTMISYFVGFSALEPTVGLDDKKNIFYAASSFDVAGGRLASPDVILSSDGGKTWEDISPQAAVTNSHPITLDPYVYVDEGTDRVFNIDLTVACSYLSFSDDRGQSWTTNPLACGRPVNDHQTLFAGPPVSSPTVTYDNIVYYCWNDVATSSCSKSLDGGITFSPTGTPAFSGYQAGSEDPGFFGVDGFCGGLHGHGAVGPEGTVYLPRELCGRPMLAVSEDEGRTWEQVQVSDIYSISQPREGTGHPSVAVDTKGNVYYMWVGQKDRIPRLSVSRDRGKTWSRPVVISPPDVNEANLPQIDAGKPGKVAFVYYGSTNSPYRKCKDECTASDYQKVTWNGYIGMSANAFSKSPLFYTGTVNHPRDPLVRHFCGPGRCQNVFDFIDVVIGKDGIPYAAFTDDCTEGCVDNPALPGEGSDGLLGKLVGGPRLK